MLDPAKPDAERQKKNGQPRVLRRGAGKHWLHMTGLHGVEEFLDNSCFEKGCPTKPYATIPKSIMGSEGS